MNIITKRADQLQVGDVETSTQEQLLTAVLRDALAYNDRHGVGPSPSWVVAAREVIEKIDPPVPPNITEVLTTLAGALDDIDADRPFPFAELQRLVKRARATGMIK